MAIVTQTRNTFPRTNGYSPVQWVLGVPDLRLPGSLLDDEQAQQLEVMEAAEDPQSQMARTLNIRQNAKIAQVKMDTDARVRRALLRQSTPVRGPFPVGAYVYFYRMQQLPGASKQYRWFGPARVIGVELRNPRRLEDEDEPTEGGAPHSYWIRYGHSVVLATGEQMRFASEDELLAAHTVPHYAVANLHLRGARSFVDARPLGQGQPTREPDQQPVPAVSVETPGPGQQPPPPQPDDQAPGGVLVPIPEDMDLENELDREVDRAAHPTHPTPTTAQHTPQLPLTHHRQLTGEEPEPPPTQPPTPRAIAASLPPQTFTRQPFPPGQLSYQMGPRAANPNQLDGHGHGPMRTLPSGSHSRNETGPYIAEDEPWEDVCPTLTSAVRRLRQRQVWDHTEDSGSESEDGYLEELDVNLFGSKFEEYGQVCFQESFMTGKAARSEVNLKTLTPEKRALFDIAMQKEWSSWQRFQAVEELTEEDYKDLPGDTKIIGTRWVHTDKNSKPRMMAGYMAKKTGKTKSQVERDYPFEAKSRLVVQGCQEDDVNIRSDSPTCSLLAFNLVCVVAVIQGWIIAAFDASTAYLQSSGIARILILRCPRHPSTSSTWCTSRYAFSSSRKHLRHQGRWSKLVDEVVEGCQGVRLGPVQA